MLSVWSYELLAQPRPGRLRIAGVDVVELALLVLGLALVVLAMRVTGRHVRRTRYRPDRFGVAETLTVLCGAAGVGTVQWLRRHGDPSALTPEVAPFTWPQLTPTLLALLVVAAVPAFATPPPALTTTPAPKEGLP